jgi:predicted deacylase
MEHRFIIITKHCKDKGIKMIDCFKFKGILEGPSVLILGAIHGNETCGTDAIKRIIKQIEGGEIVLKKGTITFIPVCNPQAYEKGVREIDINLNRVLKHTGSPVFYEEFLANSLVPLIESHDFTLDIHSNHTGRNTFGFLDYPNDLAKKWTMSLGLESIVTGWPELFLPEEDFSTLACAHKAKNISITVECGYHDDPSAIDVAYECINRTLQFLDMVDSAASGPNKTQTPYMRVEHRIIKEKEGMFTKDWAHLMPIQQGQLIAKYEDGQTVSAPCDGYMFIPNSSTKIGCEWFYIAVDE